MDFPSKEEYEQNEMGGGRGGFEELSDLDALSFLPTSSGSSMEASWGNQSKNNGYNDRRQREPNGTMDYPQAQPPNMPVSPPPASAPPVPPPSSAPPPPPPPLPTPSDPRQAFAMGPPLNGGMSQVFNWGESAKGNLYDTDDEEDAKSIPGSQQQYFQHRPLPTSSYQIDNDDDDDAQSINSTHSTSNVSKSGGVRAHAPTIENYGNQDFRQPPPSFLPPIIIPIPSYSSGSSSSSTDATRGLFDTNVRPNSGDVNSASGATLKQTVLRMRVVNFLLCALVVLTEVLSWMGHILFLQASTLVLSVYLAFFAAILCAYELHWSLWTSFIRSNFGLLYSPYGRAFWLSIMATMLFARNAGLWDLLLGPIFMLDALYTFILPCQYSDYHSVYEKEGMDDFTQTSPITATGQYSWANPNTAATTAAAAARFAGVLATAEEGQSLLPKE